MSKEEARAAETKISEGRSAKSVSEVSELEETEEKNADSETHLADYDDDEEEEEEEEEEDDFEDQPFLDSVVVEDVNEAFQLFDIEDEGFINPLKLYTGLLSLGYSPTEAEIQDLIESVDRDGNGEISLDEFMEMMRQRWNESLIEENAREAFCVFDTDENDIISAEDIAPVFMRLGHNLTQIQLEQIIDAADVDGDGAVTFEDFLTVFRKKPRDSARMSKVVAAPDVSRLSTEK